MDRFDDGMELLPFNNGSRMYVYDTHSATLFPSKYVMYMNHTPSIHAGCVWNGYIWGGIKSSMQADCQWGRQRIGVDSEIEQLAVPDTIVPYEGVERSHWYPTYCAPTPDGNGLVVAGGESIVLLRF